MAYAEKSDPAEPYEYQYRKDYESDWDTHRQYILDFDAYEAMLQSQVFDSVSKSVDGAKITDSYATTLAKERADRVMAKLPEGVTESTGKADVGKAAFMDILRQKWIYPNANAQHAFSEKLNMWQFYSSVYGYMPMFYDWNVSPTGYAGPDCWLWNPRNLIPQQGRTSIADMDYVTALTWVSKKFLEGIRDEYKGKKDTAGWDLDALNRLIELAGNEKTNTDQEKDTQVARTRTPGAIRKGICLATRYESGEDGKWCVFAPDHAFVEVRKIDNPHKNGRIPFVIKYSQPLFDSFYGLGDFQRAKPLQFARDGLTNFYFRGIKNNLIPPLVANANGVLKHTLDYRAGGVLLETIPNSIRTLEVSTGGLNTYQGAMSNLTGSLLSLFGTQNASLPGAESLNPSQGKTPAAISYYGDKEASRDGAEIRHLEAAIEELIEGFYSLTINISTEDVPVSLFAEDIKGIVDAGMKDVLQLFGNIKADITGSAANLTINPSALKGVEYRFKIDSSSTVKANKEAELAGLERLMGAIGKFQNIFKDDPRVDVNWGEMMLAYEQASGIKGASKFINFDPNQPSPQQLQQQMEQMKNAPQPEAPKQIVNYKDAPEDIKRQMEQADGYQPSQNPMTPEMALKAHESDTKSEADKAKMLLDSHKVGHQQQLDSAQLDQQAHQAQLSADQQQFDQANTVVQGAQSAAQAEKSHALAEKTQADSHEVAKKSATSATMKAK